MAVIRKRRKLVYKRVSWLHEAEAGRKAKTLQECLQEALAALKRPEQRKQTAGDDETVRVLFLHRTLKVSGRGILAGVLCHYSPLHNQAVVAPDPGADEWSVAQVRPPNLDEKSKSEWVESFFYFVVKDDHLVVAPSASFTANQFEAYLDFLLGKRAKVMSETQVLSLKDAPSAKMREHGVPPVKSIKVGLPLGHEVRVLSKRRGEKATVKHVVDEKRLGAMFQWLRSFGVNLDREKFDHQEAGELQAIFELRFRPYKQFEDNTLMNEVGSLFADQDDKDYRIVLGDGTELTSGELRVQTLVDVDTDNGVPKPSAMFLALSEYLAKIFKDSLVDP